MKTRMLTALFILVLAISLQTAVFSQDEPEAPVMPTEPISPAPDGQYYHLGDKMFSIGLGLFTPLFFQSTDGSTEWTNLTLGGSGSLKLMAFLNNSIAVGGEIGGSLSFSPNSRKLFLIPITANISYIFRKFPFEFPVEFAAGLNLTKLDDNFHIDMILKPSASAYWIYNSEWSFGLNLAYNWIPEIYTGNGSVPADHTRFGNFLNVNLSALYHF